MPVQLVPSRESGDLRIPPHNIEIERALIGAIMLNNRAYDRVVDFLKAEHFTEAVNGRIFTMIAALIERGENVSAITLKSYCDNDELVKLAGGFKYLVTLSSTAVTVINAGDYGKHIYNLHLLREVICIGEDMVNAAYDAQIDESAEDQIEAAEQRLFDLTSGGTATRGGLVKAEITVRLAIDLANAAHRRDGRLSGLTTGLRDIDGRTGGMQRSDLLILAGRPSMGKTALAVNIAVNAARYYRDTENLEDRGKQVAIFSLEMSSEQLMTRILSDIAGVDSFRILTGKLTTDEFDKLITAEQEIATLPLQIDDGSGPTVATIRTRARRLARTSKTPHHDGLGLIVIDYLQLISPSQKYGRAQENRVQEISGITQGLKALAKNLNVPVLALSQLSRALEQRDDKRPQLSDLRESGTIEQDSDVVMFVFREQYYLERAEAKRKPEESDERFLERHANWLEACDRSHNIAEVNIAKQRRGPVGTIRLRFNPELTKFDTLEENHTPRNEGGPAHAEGAPPADPAAVQASFDLIQEPAT